ncbi:MAG: SDR family oxidoreductase [Acidobacteriota bacterium]
MILVVGATGNLGGAITQTLLAQGKPVRILARPPSNYAPLVERGAQVVLGDLKDTASLLPACQGVDTVITTANSVQRGGDDNVENVDLKGNRSLIDAAKQAGVKHFVFVSVQMADARSPAPFLAAKGATEEHLIASGIPYTIIAPNAFMEMWVGRVVGMPAMQGQPVTVVASADTKHSFISAADVVAFTIAALDNPAARNQRLVLGGPEPLSFRDAAMTYQRVLGRPVQVRVVNPGEPVPGLPEAIVPLLTGMGMFETPIDMTETARTFGISLIPLEQMVRRSLPAAAPS